MLYKKEYNDNNAIRERIKELKSNGESLDQMFKEQKASLENDLVERDMKARIRKTLLNLKVLVFSNSKKNIFGIDQMYLYLYARF